MTILLILIPVSVLLAGIAVWSFFWAADDGQFDDLETPAYAVLDEDGAPGAAPVHALQPSPQSSTARDEHARTPHA